jgi:hypothetical protein
VVANAQNEMRDEECPRASARGLAIFQHEIPVQVRHFQDRLGRFAVTLAKARRDQVPYSIGASGKPALLFDPPRPRGIPGMHCQYVLALVREKASTRASTPERQRIEISTKAHLRHPHTLSRCA